MVVEYLYRMEYLFNIQLRARKLFDWVSSYQAGFAMPTLLFHNGEQVSLLLLKMILLAISFLPDRWPINCSSIRHRTGPEKLSRICRIIMHGGDMRSFKRYIGVGYAGYFCMLILFYPALLQAAHSDTDLS